MIGSLVLETTKGKKLYSLSIDLAITVPCKKMAFWSIYLINWVFLAKVFEL